MRAGIDPGVTGALALLDEYLRAVHVVDMPVVSKGKRDEVNTAELGKILSTWEHDHGNFTVILEEVHSMAARVRGRNQGIASTFQFGDSFGCIRGACGALLLPVVRISPAVWKKKAGLTGKDKDMARTLAQQLYPEVDLSRKKDVGRADALLIARFGGL